MQHPHRGRSTRAQLALAAALFLTGAARAEDASVEAVGKARFMEYCAVCHGADATGNGPYASLLNKRPANLTLLAKNSGGQFPFATVYDSIDGRGPSGAHGTPDMPVWGSNWKTSGAPGAETEIRGRVLEMMLYLRSIQQ